jgi:hypothetical protein
VFHQVVPLGYSALTSILVYWLAILFLYQSTVLLVSW